MLTKRKIYIHIHICKQKLITSRYEYVVVNNMPRPTSWLTNETAGEGRVAVRFLEATLLTHATEA